MTIILLIVLSVLSFPSSILSGQESKIETTYDQEKDLTTIKLPVQRVSEDKAEYHSLDFSVFYAYPGQKKRPPAWINFELVSVVKARKLNTDLYVVFLIDGREVHYSSNRAVIRNPVQGRLWVGERMVFLVPYDDFEKLAAADHLAVRLGGAKFDFSDQAVKSLRSFVQAIRE
jgi:hypothetical protein